jgi:dolichol-phosphate mannosyltransferase
MNSLIIIPTYNEKENITKLIESVFNVEKDVNILIVDDNSPDGTGELIEDLISNKYNERLFLLKREGKLGLGTAYIAGFKWGLKKNYNYIFEMDGDFSHNPKYLPDFLEELRTNDLVLGSRYVEGGGVKNWGVIRKIISRGGSLYAKLILGLPFNDLTGGYKGFSKKVLKAIDLDDIKSNGYSFQIELTYRAYLKNFKIKEIPIVFEDRTLGKSKMSRKIFIEAIFMVIWLRLNRSKFEK